MVLDWDNLRFFLAVARTGSLTAASKELQVAQTTVGRRILSLETGLASKLLERTPDGYLLTAAGENLYAQAERIEAEIQAMIREAGGSDAKAQGLVRIACAESIAAHVLAPKLGDFHLRHPGMLIEILPYVHLSLAMREADIAVQLDRPDQNELVAKRIGHLAFGMYASHRYFDKFGTPDFEAGCPGHSIMTVIGDTDVDAQSKWARSMAFAATQGFQTASHGSLVAAAAAGGGLACLARFQGDRHVRLRMLHAPRPAPKAPIWMLVHNDKRRSPRIAIVMAAIVDAVKSMAIFLDPDR